MAAAMTTCASVSRLARVLLFAAVLGIATFTLGAALQTARGSHVAAAPIDRFHAPPSTTSAPDPVNGDGWWEDVGSFWLMKIVRPTRASTHSASSILRISILSHC